MRVAATRPQTSTASRGVSGTFRKLATALRQAPAVIPGAPVTGGRVGGVPLDKVTISDLAQGRAAEEADREQQEDRRQQDIGSPQDPQLAGAQALMAKRQVSANGVVALAAHTAHTPGAALKLLT